jgi:hypothetical protein
MTERTMTIFKPRAMHPDTFGNPACTIADVEQERLVTYCRHHQVGGVYHVEGGIWALYTPIDLASFIGSLADRGIRLPEGPDLERWLDAVGAVRADGGALN